MSKSTKAIAAIFAGAAIGVGVGILFAPDRGENTRGRIKKGFSDKSEDLKNKFGSLTDMLKMKYETTKDNLESTIDDFAANVDEKTPEVIATLERKLSELKAAAASLRR
jgi:gas vesicle protein